MMLITDLEFETISCGGNSDTEWSMSCHEAVSTCHDAGAPACRVVSFFSAPRQRRLRAGLQSLHTQYVLNYALILIGSLQVSFYRA